MTGRVITFYSYKGGVGRTFLLANVAALLAMWGRKVLAVDFDLEAPGLDRYFEDLLPHAAREGEGVLEIIERLDKECPPRWRECVQAVRLDRAPGRLDLLRAGKSHHYGERLGGVHWPTLYERGIGRRIEAMRAEWVDEYDFVVIDSRTGLTDSGGVCTVQLPDIVVFVVTATLSSLEGAVETMQRAARSRRGLPIDRAEMRFLPVPSRFHAWDDRSVAGPWRDRYQAAFEPFYDEWADVGVESSRLLDLLKVPHNVLWTFGEQLAVVKDRITDGQTVSYYIATITALLARDLEDTAELIRSRDEYVSKAESGSVTPGAFAFDAFLSYGAPDRDLARLIAAELRQRELRVWWDGDLRFGESPFLQLENALQTSRAMVWLGDPASQFQQREVAAFDELRTTSAAGTRPLIPVRLKRSESLVAPLADLQAIDATGMSPAQIADAIAAALAGEVAPRRAVERGMAEQERPLDAWRRHQAELHRNLIPFFAGASELMLERMFVDLDLERDAGALHAGVDEGAAEGEELRGWKGRSGERSHTLEELLQPEDGRAVAPRVAVLGEPGAGKTTLARNLTRMLAQRVDGPLPVFVSLARWSESTADPFDFAAGDLAVGSPAAAAGLAQELRTLAGESNRLWLLLDGLDEVAAERMDDTRARIEQLAEAWPHVSIAVFSRPAVFEARTLGRAFAIARVRPLDPPRQRELLDKLLGAEDAAATWRQIEPHPSLADLARNPLLLTLLAMIGRDALAAGKPLPNRRARLYDASLDLLLRRGHCPEPRGVKDRSTARSVLRRLSLVLHQQGGEAWTQAEISEALWTVRRAEEALSFQVKETWATNEAFLKDVGENSGILAAHDGPREPWRYLHRSFREFLVAEALRDGGTTMIDGQLAVAGEVAGQEAEDDDATPLDRYVARWGEVWGLLAALVDDAAPILTKLAQASGEIVRRVLPTVDGLPPAQGLAFLFDSGDFTFDDLWRLVRSWGATNDVAASALWPCVTPERSTEQLAYLFRAMEALGQPPDRAAFFQACGRPIDRVPAIDWADIPAGTFVMGAAKSQWDDERPQHEVTVPAFRLAKTTITRAQYRQFDPQHESQHFENVPAEETDRLPVTDVSWWDAWLFCRWIGGRLPSEAEWEYACRAGTTTEYSSGDAERDLDRVGWYDKNSKDRPHAVGGKPANPWGLHDMHGNVWEWCADHWHDDYEGAPVDGSVWEDGPSGLRVYRGGSFAHGAARARSAFRDRHAPADRWRGLGFRPASPSPPVDFTPSPLRHGLRDDG